MPFLPEPAEPAEPASVLVTGLLVFPCIATMFGKQACCSLLLKNKYIVSRKEMERPGPVRGGTGFEGQEGGKVGSAESFRH